ncbi:MAG TPA: PIN domain-containing protein [Tepidisphaeraceae bacterium]|nr:PIN domain-containing protein [Tepidisphaeraceae bacterium]
MIFYVLRALFVLLMAAVGWFYVTHPGQQGNGGWGAMPVAIAIALLFIATDMLSPRRKLAIFAGSFFGLIVGITIAYALSFVVGLLVDNYYQPGPTLKPSDVVAFTLHRDSVKAFIDMMIGVVSCYLSISFILQTKDDFRFIIPYVEFSKQTKGARPMLLDTSVLIDGRIIDIAETGLLESQLVVPHFVLDELQAVADSADRLKRARGRRGLDMLTTLRNSTKADVALYESPREEDGGAVDQRLVQLARSLNARVLTNDYNLNKVAQLTGVDVININDLGTALRPVVIPGEKMRVTVVKPGEEPGQGVGYLEDGTMVVIEQARPHVNEEVEFTVTRSLQTSAGRMIFGRLGSETAATAPSRSKAPSTR